MERAHRRATPPTGLRPSDVGSEADTPEPSEAVSSEAVSSEAASPAPRTRVCPRCSAENASHIRFCINCGFHFPAEESSPAAVPESSAVESSDASGPDETSEAATEASTSAGPVCAKCGGVGDPGAAFCKFCGAKYPTAETASEDAQGAVGAEQTSAPASERISKPQRKSKRRRRKAPRALAVAPEAPPEPTPMPAPVEAPAEAAAEPSLSPSAPPSNAASSNTASSNAASSNAVSPEASALLISIQKDGSDGRHYPLSGGTVDIGRSEGDIVLDDDPYLSPRHARLQITSQGLLVHDLDSVNGVYLRVEETVELADRDMILVGQQVLRFELLSELEKPLGPANDQGVMIFGTPGVKRVARLMQYTTEGLTRDVHYIYREETIVGREQGDLVFTDDPFMSRRHALIHYDRKTRRFTLRDLGSSNGTALRGRGTLTIRSGSQFRVGRHLFRYEHR